MTAFASSLSVPDLLLARRAGPRHRQRRGPDADGLVGVVSDQRVEGGRHESRRLTATLYVLGTAVRRTGRRRPAPDLVLTLDQETR